MKETEPARIFDCRSKFSAQTIVSCDQRPKKIFDGDVSFIII